MKDCSTHYEYLAEFVDDLIIVSQRPLELVKELKTLGEVILYAPNVHGGRGKQNYQQKHIFKIF